MNIRLLLFFFFAFGAVIACRSDKPEPETVVMPENELAVRDAWARPGKTGAISAAYLIILNGTDSPDTLLAVVSGVAGNVELHETYDAGDGMMGMRKAGAIPVPAGESIRLRPGGLHIMLMNLQRDLAADSAFALTLVFARNGSITVPVTVKRSD